MEYQTLAISPVGGQVRRTQDYIKSILTGSFSWHDKSSGKMVVNNCKISWFFVKSVMGDKAATYYLNGSRTDYRSIGDDKGSKLQGNDWYYMSYDEYPRSHHLEVEVDANLMPRLAVYGGDIDFVGTSDMNSPSLQYVSDLIEEAEHDSKNYYVQTGSMYDNDFVSQKNRQKILNSIKDDEMKKQIIEGAIIMVGGKIFRKEVISNIWVPGQQWTDEGFMEKKMVELYLKNGGEIENYIYDLYGSVWKLPPVVSGYAMGKYVIAMDWHISEGGDETVIYVIRVDVLPHEMYYYCGTKRGDPYTKHDKIRNLHTIFNRASLVVDSQGVGQQLQYDLGDVDPVCFDSVSKGKEKKGMINILKNFLNFRSDGELLGRIRAPYIKSLSKQLSVYREDDTKLKQDYVMTLGVACWFIENYGVPADVHKDKRY